MLYRLEKVFGSQYDEHWSLAVFPQEAVRQLREGDNELEDPATWHAYQLLRRHCTERRIEVAL